MEKKRIFMKILKIFSLIMVIMYTMYYYFSRGLISNIKDFLMNGDSIIGPINATTYTKISGGFSVAYSLMQCTGGYLLDKISIVILYPLFLIGAAISTYFFSQSFSVNTLIFYRYLIGAFFSITSIGSMKYIAVIWKKHFVLILSISKTLMCFSSALSSSNILQSYMIINGWRVFVKNFSLFGFIIGIFLYFSLLLVYNPKYNQELEAINNQELEEKKLNTQTISEEKPSNIFMSFKILFQIKGFIWIAIFSFAASSSAYVLMDGWGSNLLHLKFPNIDVLNIISPATISMIGAGIGHIYNIYAAKKFSFKVQILIYGLINLISLISIMYLPLNVNGFLTCFFLLGFTCSAQNLGFRWTELHVTKKELGFSFGILNFICMFFGCALMQNSAGFLLDLIKNKRILSIGNYQGYIYLDFSFMFKFLFIPIILSILPIFFLKNQKDKSSSNNIL